MSAHGSRRSRRILVLGGALTAGLSLVPSSDSLGQGRAGPVVTVEGGQVQGRLQPATGGVFFKGIPYAGAPAGELRWRETPPVKPWQGVRQAGEYGAPCPQPPGPTPQTKSLSASAKEDCLFLNIWVPKWPASGKTPVMMWIHGGNNSNNSGEGGVGKISPVFDGTSLARHGVIVVTINYRMGLMGIIGHPELTAESRRHASGNYSLQDQIAALKWIHNNIARFGGDPGNVTVFGQSGGARFTTILLTSPLTKGLIHRAINQSGNNIGRRPYLTHAELEQMGVALAEVLKAPKTGQMKYLRSLPASQIAAAMPALMEKLKQMNYLAFEQGVDGYVITQNPAEVYRSHKELAIPMITGTTALDSGVRDQGAPPLTMTSSRAEILSWMRSVLTVFYGKYPDLLKQALQIYGVTPGPNQVSTYPPYGTPEAQLAIDFNHRCDSLATAAWHSKLAPTWSYEYSWMKPDDLPVHESELRYVFGVLGDKAKDAGARKLSEDMEGYWTNFAKTGDPNGPGLPVWPKYDTASQKSLEFTNDGPKERTGVREAVCKPFIERFTRDEHPLLGGTDTRLGGNLDVVHLPPINLKSN